MERHHQPSGTVDELEGIIVQLEVAVGSKSQHRRPVLQIDEGHYAQVHVEGDSYFDAPTLKALINRRIRLTGRWDNLIIRVSPDELLELGDQEFTLPNKAVTTEASSMGVESVEHVDGE